MAEEPDDDGNTTGDEAGPTPREIVRTVVAALLFAHWCGPDRTSAMAKDFAVKAFDRADDFLEILSTKEPDLKAAML